MGLVSNRAQKNDILCRVGDIPRKELKRAVVVRVCRKEYDTEMCIHGTAMVAEDVAAKAAVDEEKRRRQRPKGRKYTDELTLKMDAQTIFALLS